MAKVKPPCQNCGAQYANGKDNVIPVKNGILLPRKLSKRRKDSLEKRTHI
jgi:hypothetical protein